MSDELNFNSYKIKQITGNENVKLVDLLKKKIIVFFNLSANFSKYIKEQNLFK